MVWEVHHEQEFDVDAEAAMMIEDFELEHLLAQYDNGCAAGGIGWAYKWYAQFGVLTLSHAQLAKHDEVLRRTAYKDRLGLTLDYSVDDLLARAVAFEDLPVGAQMAWRPAKMEEAEAAPADLSNLVAKRAPAAVPSTVFEVQDTLLDTELIDNDESQMRLAL